MKPLTEQEIRDIVQDEMMKNYTSGNPFVPPHEHNGTDGLNILPINIEGWTPIPASPQKYLNTLTGGQEFGFGSPQQLIGSSSTNGPQYVNNDNTCIYPLPVIVGNGRISGQPQGDFNGGAAPDGTILFFSNGVTGELHVRFDGRWFGVDLSIIT